MNVYTSTALSNANPEYSTSTARIAVPSGLRKMAERPAAMPTSMRVRRSSSGSLSQVAVIEPNPEAIWAVGPSRPADPPDPIVSALAIILTMGTRVRT